ncbi:MAG: hypothetical protein P4L16_00190 [Chlamydiales bacterium]|nr:hypothetical protein [Chlamydiales bacterium]
MYKPIGNDHGIEFRARVLGAGPILGALTFGVMVVVGGALTLIPGGQAVGAAVIAVAPETAAAATALPTP